MATLVPRCRDAGGVYVASLANGRSLEGTAQWGFLLTFCEWTASLTGQNHPLLGTWVCKRFRKKVLRRTSSFINRDMLIKLLGSCHLMKRDKAPNTGRE